MFPSKVDGISISVVMIEPRVRTPVPRNRTGWISVLYIGLTLGFR